MIYKKFYIIFSLFCLSVSTQPMMKALNIAATGMSAQETNVSTISNNIANVNTVAYKKQRTEFETLLYETRVDAGSRSSSNSKYNVGIQVGSGTKVSAIRREFSPGNPQITNNPLDLMIKGEGFFGLVLPNQQVRYTRDGSFNVNAQGLMVNKKGYQVMPILQFPPNTVSVSISDDGLIEAWIKNQMQPTNVGQIPIYTFTNPVGLKASGGNLYSPTTASGIPQQNIAGQNKSGAIEQGSLETSNVSIMNEMSNLIKAQRAYEMNAKVMKITDEMMQTVNNLR
jgi:flagellar basal-body rod protein FlgG